MPRTVKEGLMYDYKARIDLYDNNQWTSVNSPLAVIGIESSLLSAIKSKVIHM